MADHPRIDELRRRVDEDPASIAFAQLAEEYRRLGAFDEAVRVCRTGLAQHPSYLSARVTLARALMELQQFEEACTELESVLRTAPDNLAGLRALAELHKRRGDFGAAFKQFSTAQAIARDVAGKLPPPVDFSSAVDSFDSGALELTGPPPADPALAELEQWLDAVLTDRILRGTRT